MLEHFDEDWPANLIPPSLGEIVLGLLIENGSLTLNALAAMTGMKRSSLRAAIARLLPDQVVALCQRGTPERLYTMAGPHVRG